MRFIILQEITLGVLLGGGGEQTKNIPTTFAKP